ncbi:MAG: addiction module protein [Acidobacteriia bacterium]|nr:addiction module protein [Terriglobia bacterium]
MERDAAEDQPVDTAAEETWREEIYRRLQQIDSGAVPLIPWNKARRRLRPGWSREQGHGN